jgi:alanine racemase
MAFSPNVLKIDLSSIAHNLGQVKKLIDPGTRIMAMVKSDAYGHGLLPVSRLLERSGAHFLGVAHIQEALELRKNGVRLPIAIFCGIKGRDDSDEVVDKDLTPVIFDLSSAELLNKEALKRGKRINIHLKIDTGMSRLGIIPSEAGRLMQKIMEYPGLNLEGLASHLSSADESDPRYTEEQTRSFRAAIDMGRTMGLGLPLNSLANSAGVMAHRGSHFDMVRPGIMLYGGLPSVDFDPPLPLKQAMGFSSEILQIRDLNDRTPVSYGRRYFTKGPRRIAIVSAGYGDGLPRSLSNRGSVLVKGNKVDIVGTVCMNMFMCDVTGIRDASPGDEVVILGAQGDEVITGDEFAEWSDTISYEVFLSIGQVNAKEYIE